jgi:hypothetical protein
MHIILFNHSCICITYFYTVHQRRFTFLSIFLARFCGSTHPLIFLKVHKIENFFDSDFGICVISLLVMHK